MSACLSALTVLPCGSLIAMHLAVYGFLSSLIHFHLSFAVVACSDSASLSLIHCALSALACLLIALCSLDSSMSLFCCLATSLCCTRFHVSLVIHGLLG